jgi:hypothetical protein
MILNFSKEQHYIDGATVVFWMIDHFEALIQLTATALFNMCDLNVSEQFAFGPKD